ncbi:hypothetical protein [Staphylococcus epidermidis]|uniref:hypothetical protein n=1 Tax=Staphylococcus epidermidis TaxID=1282 RepID=UPI0021A3DD88|nr:hypothetical protein [Staphylococcus epidermidis]MCT1537353.1 hypothetical protein [Staphylococcus epidermidis]
MLIIFIELPINFLNLRLFFISILLILELVVIVLFILLILSIMYVGMMLESKLNDRKMEKSPKKLFKKMVEPLIKQPILTLCIFIALIIGAIRTSYSSDWIVTVIGSIVVYISFELIIEYFSKEDDFEKKNLEIMNKAWVISLNFANISYDKIPSNFTRWLKCISDILVEEFKFKEQESIDMIVFNLILFVVFLLISTIFINQNKKNKEK